MLMIILIIRYETNGPSFYIFVFFENFPQIHFFISIQKIDPYIDVIIINVEVTRLNTWRQNIYLAYRCG